MYNYRCHLFPSCIGESLMNQNKIIMGSNNLTLQNLDEKKTFSMFLRKNSKIHLCINNKNETKQTILNSKEAKIIAQKLFELSEKSEILKKTETAKESKSYNYDPNINSNLIDSLVQEIVDNIEEKN